MSALKYSTWWERLAAFGALAALIACLSTGNISCGRQDLFISGDFPTHTPLAGTPTQTETPDPDEEV